MSVPPSTKSNKMAGTADESTEVIRKLKEEVVLLKSKLERISTITRAKSELSDALVSYARKKDKTCVRSVEVMYPDATATLNGKEGKKTALWTHGFNSGVLGLSRLMLEVLHAEEDIAQMDADNESETDDDRDLPLSERVALRVQDAMDVYPNLDT